MTWNNPPRNHRRPSMLRFPKKFFHPSFSFLSSAFKYPISHSQHRSAMNRLGYRTQQARWHFMWRKVGCVLYSCCSSSTLSFYLFLLCPAMRIANTIESSSETLVASSDGAGLCRALACLTVTEGSSFSCLFMSSFVSLPPNKLPKVRGLIYHEHLCMYCKSTEH